MDAQNKYWTTGCKNTESLHSRRVGLVLQKSVFRQCYERQIEIHEGCKQLKEIRSRKSNEAILLSFSLREGRAGSKVYLATSLLSRHSQHCLSKSLFPLPWWAILYAQASPWQVVDKTEETWPHVRRSSSWQHIILCCIFMHISVGQQKAGDSYCHYSVDCVWAKRAILLARTKAEGKHTARYLFSVVSGRMVAKER